MVSPAEAQALFRRFGYESVMPAEQFVHTLITQPSRQLAQEMPGVCACVSACVCVYVREC